jgi:hypothetical protein
LATITSGENPSFFSSIAAAGAGFAADHLGLELLRPRMRLARGRARGL